jgi:hypothetical protein
MVVENNVVIQIQGVKPLTIVVEDRMLSTESFARE